MKDKGIKQMKYLTSYYQDIDNDKGYVWDKPRKRQNLPYNPPKKSGLTPEEKRKVNEFKARYKGRSVL